MLDVSGIRKAHKEQFGTEPVVFMAPGRVNLIGEHTDYADGFVMPAAIDFATLAAISSRADNSIAVYSANFDEQVTHRLENLPTNSTHHWSDYPLGVVAA